MESSSHAELGEALRQFLTLHVHSFEDLEVLLHVRAHAKRDFSVEDLARDLGIAPEFACSALVKLSRGGLLRQRETDSLVYEYGATDDLAARVDELARAYVERRIDVIATIGSNAIGRVKSSASKTFAEVFMVRDEPKKDL